MFNLQGKEAKTSPAKIPKNLYPITTPQKLLNTVKRKALLEKISEYTALEESRFQSIGIILINNLINHAQTLPESMNSYYSMPGGILDYTLNRTDAALELFRQFIIQEDGEQLSDNQRLWLYALFSASILKGVGKLHTDYNINIHDEHGHLIKKYNAILESMPAIGTNYYYEFNKADPEHDTLRIRLTILLAERLMPRTGFEWIASDSDVLASWLALLMDDQQASGMIGTILIRADAIAIQRYIEDFMIKGIGNHANRDKSHSNHFIDSKQDAFGKEQVIASKFMRWIQAAIESGKIMINKPPLFMVPGGMLMSADVFKYFIQEHPEYKSVVAVQKAFLSLGLHKTAADGTNISRFQQQGSHNILQGILLTKYATLLPGAATVYNLSTGKVSTQSAVEVIHAAQTNTQFNDQKHLGKAPGLQELNQAGKWQNLTAASAGSFLSPNYNTNG